ncbi:hypothetical protein Dimus_018761, partial [Dionaea muscipula]
MVEDAATRHSWLPPSWLPLLAWPPQGGDAAAESTRLLARHLRSGARCSRDRVPPRRSFATRPGELRCSAAVSPRLARRSYMPRDENRELPPTHPCYAVAPHHGHPTARPWMSLTAHW